MFSGRADETPWRQKPEWGPQAGDVIARTKRECLSTVACWCAGLRW